MRELFVFSAAVSVCTRAESPRDRNVLAARMSASDIRAAVQSGAMPVGGSHAPATGNTGRLCVRAGSGLRIDRREVTSRDAAARGRGVPLVSLAQQVERGGLTAALGAGSIPARDARSAGHEKSTTPGDSPENPRSEERPSAAASEGVDPTFYPRGSFEGKRAPGAWSNGVPDAVGRGRVRANLATGTAPGWAWCAGRPCNRPIYALMKHSPGERYPTAARRDDVRRISKGPGPRLNGGRGWQVSGLATRSTRSPGLRIDMPPSNGAAGGGPRVQLVRESGPRAGAGPAGGAHPKQQREPLAHRLGDARILIRHESSRVRSVPSFLRRCA